MSTYTERLIEKAKATHPEPCTFESNAEFYAEADPTRIASLAASHRALVETMAVLTGQCEAEFTVDGMWSDNGQAIEHRSFHKAKVALAQARTVEES